MRRKHPTNRGYGTVITPLVAKASKVTGGIEAYLV